MKRTLFFLVLASILPLVFGFVFYPFLKYTWGNNPRYHIQTIVQKKPPQDALKCAYLAETLNLTSEKINLYHFNLKEAEKKLLATVVIKEASVKKWKPHTLFIDYTLRRPLAYLADRANTALDEEGILFPFAPFYTPKHLPEIYLGDHFVSSVWGKKITEKKMHIVKEILSIFPLHSISWIDVSNIEAASLGKKEIIVEYRNYLLRLSPKRYVKEISHFFLWYKKMQEEQTDFIKGSFIIDLRLPNMAYIRKQIV